MCDSAPVESEFHQLPFSEQFLLWAIRQWVKTYKNEGDLHATLHEGFCVAGIEDGYLAIDELLTIFSVAAVTRIDVRCPHCTCISPDEQMFIGLVAAFQRSDLAEARKFLELWLSPTGIRTAHRPAARLARAMALGRLILRPRTLAPSSRRQLLADEPPHAGDHAALPTLH